MPLCCRWCQSLPDEHAELGQQVLVCQWSACAGILHAQQLACNAAVPGSIGKLRNIQAVLSQVQMPQAVYMTNNPVVASAKPTAVSEAWSSKPMLLLKVSEASYVMICRGSCQVALRGHELITRKS